MKFISTVAAVLLMSLASESVLAQVRYHWHYEVAQWADSLARTSDRVALMQYGTTPERRPLQLLAFGLPEHIAALDAIQANQQARAEGRPTDERFDDLAVVWLSYDVHGNEASCTEAALEVMAELADPASARAEAWLDRLIVLVDPCLNPDGHDRFVHFVEQRSTVPANPEPAEWSHMEPWPGGRVNHYLFDLNRDWAWARQPETQARLVAYNAWLPHVHGDFHEMGYNSPYYFAPAAAPYHELITPWQRLFQERVGEAAAADFDQRGERYFTREDFDLFYPSYGDTYPIFRGAIGMTYEQGGGPRSAAAVRLENGKVLDLAQRVKNHVHSSFALLDVCAGQTPTLLAESDAYFSRSRAGAPGAYGAYILPAGQPQLAELLPFFDLHGIAYGHAAPPKKAAAGFDYFLAEERPITWSAADWVVPANQPHGGLLQVLMDPDPFLEDSLTYDITAWALPYAYGIACYGVDATVDVEPATFEPVRSDDLDAGAYGFAVVPRGAAERAFVARCNEAGLAGRLLTKPSTLGPHALPAGAVVYLTTDQTVSDWTNAVNALDRTGVELLSLASGHATAGVDLGSDAVRWMGAPRIAVLGGAAVRALSLGEIWWHFEREWGIAPTILDADRLPDLKAWDVIILPDGVRGSALEAVEEFALQGGTVIALGDAVRAVSRWESTELTAANDRPETPEDPLAVPYADRSRHWASRSIEGAIYALRTDATHPIAFTEGERAFVLKQGSDAWLPLSDGVNVAVYAEDRPVSGHAGHLAAPELADRLAIGVESIGQGQIVYFMDNPLFRGFWEEGKAYFDRAILFSGVY